jgi:hypothetical protein
MAVVGLHQRAVDFAAMAGAAAAATMLVAAIPKVMIASLRE